MKRGLIILLFIILGSILVYASPPNTLLEGETQTVVSNGITYKIKLVMVADNNQKAIFEVNGRPTNPIGESEGYDFPDGSKIRVGEVLIQESGDGRDLVEFYFYGARNWQQTEGEYIVDEFQSSSISSDISSVDKVSYEDLIPLFQQQPSPQVQKPQLIQEVEQPEELPEFAIHEDPAVKSSEPEKNGFFARILGWFLNLFR